MFNFDDLQKTIDVAQERWKKIEKSVEEMRAKPEDIHKIVNVIVLLVEHLKPTHTSSSLKDIELGLETIISNIKK